MNRYLIILLFAGLFACTTKNKPSENVVQTAPIVGLATPMQLVLVYSKDVLIIHRAYFGQHVWMVLNKGNTPVMIPFDVFELQKNNITKTAIRTAGNIFLRTVKNKTLFADINPDAPLRIT